MACQTCPKSLNQLLNPNDVEIKIRSMDIPKLLEHVFNQKGTQRMIFSGLGSRTFYVSSTRKVHFNDFSLVLPILIDMSLRKGYALKKLVFRNMAPIGSNRRGTSATMPQKALHCDYRDLTNQYSFQQVTPDSSWHQVPVFI